MTPTKLSACTGCNYACSRRGRTNAVRAIIALVLFTLCPPALYSQAGKDVFPFLNLPTGARQAAFGGSNISIYDDDLNFAFANPALLSKNTHNFLGINYTNQFNDVNIGSAIYGRNFGEKNFTAYGAHYIDYGRFMGTTENDVFTGYFTAKDMAFSGMYARMLSPRWTVGGTFKMIWSVFERYHSVGCAFDFGVSYHNEKALFSAGLVLRNLGFQFKGYYSIDGRQHHETLPLDLQIGISQKLPKAPLRFSLTLHNMQTWDLGYRYGNEVDDPMAEKSKAARGADMFFRHTIWAVEILPMKNMYIVASYNHRRRMEMAVKGKRSIAGFAFGAGLKVYKFNVGFSVVPFQTGSIGYNITFSTNLSEFGIK